MSDRCKYDDSLRFSHDAHDFYVPALMNSAFDQSELGLIGFEKLVEL